MDFDVAIIGGGSAGYAAASSAQSLGAQVAIIDPGPLGGLCILKGCMPTKAILRSSDIMAMISEERRIALVGIHPLRIHNPPKGPGSMIATWAPSDCAEEAAA